MSDQRYIEIPGDKTHELPPLLVSPGTESGADLNSVMGEAEEMLALTGASEEIWEQRKFDLACQLAERYQGLLAHWFWGDSILDWVRQCEISFENEDTLRKLVHPDVWPHASRASFVELLRAKALPIGGVTLEKAVGLRLAFRQPPPIDCVSNQFLFYLDSTITNSAYDRWSHLSMTELALLPPDRFHFDVVDVSVS
jgi:hypothetical protein